MVGVGVAVGVGVRVGVGVEEEHVGAEHPLAEQQRLLLYSQFGVYP